MSVAASLVWGVFVQGRPIAWAQPAAVSGKASASDIDEGQAAPWSEGVSIEDRRRALAHFRKGNEQARANFRFTAVGEYEKAIAVWKHPAFHYNLAFIQIELNKLPEAFKSFERALAHGPEPLGPEPRGKERYEVGQRHRDELRARLARVVITCDEPGAEVLVNGQRLFVGARRYEDMLAPGVYHVEARKDGMISDTRPSVVISAGRSAEIDLVLRYERTARRMPAWVPWVVAGAGVAALAGAGWSHREAARGFREYDDAFDAFASRDPMEPVSDEMERMRERAAIESMREDAEGWRDRARVAYIAGGVALVGGAVLFLLNRERTVELESRPLVAGARAVSVVPVITGDTVGVSAGLAF